MAIRRSTASILALGLVLVGLLAISHTQAQARAFPTSSSFGFFTGPDTFVGDVVSNNARCRSGRLVKVFREAGRRDRLVGRVRANSTGYWQIRRSVPRARYYALIPRKSLSSGGRNFCRAYKSSTLPFG